MVRPEILPENVLVRTPDMLVWWRPAQRRKMFFRHEDKLGVVSGRVFPITILTPGLSTAHTRCPDSFALAPEAPR